MRVFFNVVKATAILAAIFILTTVLTMIIWEFKNVINMMMQNVGVGTFGKIAIVTLITFAIQLACRDIVDDEINGGILVLSLIVSIIVSIVIYGLNAGIPKLLDSISDLYLTRLMVSGCIVWVILICVAPFKCSNAKIQQLLRWTPKPPQQPNNKK